jgi:hypothetical protein
MLDNYKSVPFLAAISILLLTPVGIGALVYSSVRSDYADQSSKKAGESTAASSPQFAPSAPSAPSSGGHDLNPTTGIPTGTYSNPPTTIKSGSGIAPSNASPQNNPQPTDDFPSSVDRNRAIQQSLNNSPGSYSIPDYSSPAPSNNYQSTQDNSLIEPLSESSLLETPESTPEPVVPLAPVVQPRSQLAN